MPLLKLIARTVRMLLVLPQVWQLRLNFTIIVICLMSTYSWVFFLILRTQKEYYLNLRAIPNKDLKYILLMKSKNSYPFDFSNISLEGQGLFLKYRCPEVNCYATYNRNLFKDDLTKFDAIVFDGGYIHNLPKKRTRQQKYIFISTESARNYPVCTNKSDFFFNWTATYRLDSEVPMLYISIENAAGEIVGPKIDMEWINRTSVQTSIDEELYLNKVRNKSKAAAWFVSNCRGRSGRRIFAKKLQRSMNFYNLQLDVYGACGTHKCPRGNPNCSKLLEDDYFFYLSLENSFSEDYVTEKLLTAVNHFTIPIVYGGANYSRFLPPYSYIDGNAMSTQDIAALMHRLIQSPKLYLEYMWWRDHYSFQNPYKEHICNLCSALHDEIMLEKHSVYSNFREWWYPEYKKICKGS